ncbi:polysaccharide biosynthesis/export family protein [Bacteroidales bacterium]|nr:polysaccharide biosynthesis/export family protein [Bacteroidales bacterium]
MKKTIKLLIPCLSLLFLFSCVSVSKLKYIQDSGVGVAENIFFNTRSVKTIQPYDNIYIRVYSLEEETAMIFASRTYGTSTLTGYAVTDSGYINFPFVGNIYVKDLSIDEAQNNIQRELEQYLTNISISVRFIGNTITILGEVRRPGQISYVNEKINVFQALGLAGGVADYGNKERVKLIREKDNVINTIEINLTDKSLLESQYYYLLPNDIIIVEGVKAKYRNLTNFGLITAPLAVLSTLVGIILSVQVLRENQ